MVRTGTGKAKASHIPDIDLMKAVVFVEVTEVCTSHVRFMHIYVASVIYEITF